MNTFLKIAWRSVWRNRRRSFLTISMIAFGLFLGIFMKAMIAGTKTEVFKNAIQANIGSFQIHAKDYQENQTLSEAFTLTPQIQQLLSSEARIKAWAPRIVSAGLVSVGDNTNVAMITGIDPTAEARVSVLKDKLMTGPKLAEKYPHLYPKPPPESRYLSPKAQHEIMIGDKLAAKLEAKIGDQLAAMVQGADGSMGAELYQIVGVYHTGFETDQGFYMHIDDADALFSMYGQISMLTVIMPNMQQIPDVVAKFRQDLDPKQYEVLGWYDITPELVNALELKDASNNLLMGVLLLIIGFGILNTIFITIMERIQEYGVLKSMGTSPRQIFALVYFETLFLTLIGIASGNLLGAGLSFYFQAHPIDLSMMAETYEELGFSMNALATEPHLEMFVSLSVVTFLLALIAALYPALKAARLNPLDALKHL